MAKRAATYRLEAESLEWVAGYAEERSRVDGRKVSQADVIEMGIAALRGDATGGVPDLPEADLSPAVERVQNPKPRAVSGVVRASSLVPLSPLAMERQRKLNEASARARVGAPKAKAKK